MVSLIIFVCVCDPLLYNNDGKIICYLFFPWEIISKQVIQVSDKHTLGKKIICFY